MNKAPSVPLEKVEWRVDGKPFKWSNRDMCRFVPYMDGRDAANLLDEWVGPENWSDEYVPVSGVDGKPAMWCHLSIRFEGEWVTKRDVGVASNFEAMKGIVSDAFKRVATIKWGVGRNVYDLPTLVAPCRVDQKGNAYPTDDTLPYILNELKKQGFDASTGRVANVGGAGSQRATEAEEAPPSSQASGEPKENTKTPPQTSDLPPWLRSLRKNYDDERIIHATNVVRQEKGLPGPPLEEIDEVGKAKPDTQEQILKKLTDKDFEVPEKQGTLA